MPLPWRMLPPKLFPPMTTVQHYFYRWRHSPSVKPTESGGPRGYDAGKKINGRKRHIVTDTQGLLVGAVVHTADIQDRDGAPDVLASIHHSFPWLRYVFADGGYAGDKLRTALTKIGQWTLQIIG